MRQVNKEILHLALPSILANITVPLVGMVDIAVAGHLGSGAVLIGAIAVGSMLFDLLYWNFGFLRVSTGGLTAQAYGRWQSGDDQGRIDCAQTLYRSLAIALIGALALIAVQWLFVQGAFLVIKCSPEVRDLAEKYFYIRIWAAPATLSLLAFKGWFIGMQDSISSMATDLVVNIVNIAASILLAMGLGFAGVALGTVVAQYCGVICALIFLFTKYRKRVFVGVSRSKLFSGEQNRKFFSMNGDVFVRSLCFIAIYIGYTLISARYGDVLLSVTAVLMKLLMIFSYFIDGFAYAGEAMTGKYIGLKDSEGLRSSVRWNFVWCGAIVVAFMFIYGLGGELLFRVMTDDVAVLAASKEYIPWLLVMPIVGCAAFAWDGIYIGAVASKAVRNAMLLAAAAFFGVWFLGIWVFNPGTAVTAFHATPESAIHLLMAAYFAHLLARTIYMTVRYKRDVRCASLPAPTGNPLG